MTTLQGLLEQVRRDLAKKKPRPAYASSAEHYEHEWAEVYQHSGWVYRLWVQQCSCGAVSYGLAGLFEERKHPRLGHLIQRRIDDLSSVPANVEARIETNESPVAVCLECAGIPQSLIDEALNAQTEELDPEDQVARRSAGGAGCEGSHLAA